MDGSFSRPYKPWIKRVLMFISDDFSGMSEAIKTLFPYSDIQKCIVHLDRNLYRNMQKDDAKFVTKKLYEIKATCNTYQSGILLYQSDVLDKFKKNILHLLNILKNVKQNICAF